MNRQNANGNFLYKLHPLQWSVVAILVLNLVVPFAPSRNEQSHDGHVQDIGDITTISSFSNDDPKQDVENKNNSSNAISVMPPNPRVFDKDMELDLFQERQIEIPSKEVERLTCYELGPISTENVENGLRKILMAKGMALEMRVVKQKEPIGFWVFIPPLRSRSLGRLQVEEIKLKGVKDVVLLTKNKPRYSVSLGIFKKKKFAKQRLLKIQSLGFDAKLEVRYKSLDEKWLFVEVAEKDDIEPHEWEQILSKYQLVEIRPQECK